MENFETIALIGKYKSPEIAGPLLDLANFFEQRGRTVVVDPLTAVHVGEHRRLVLPLEEIGRQADLAVVIGGDGTMLNIARTLAPFDVALVGVNVGRLGFLTDVSIDTMFETFADMLEGEYIVEPRMLLHAEVRRSGGRVMDVVAFNDVSVNKGAEGSLIELEVLVNGQHVYDLRADGLIVATPTGSTAYALSAGGPIVHPSLSVLSLVPVCPHTLSNRPIIVSAESSVEVLVQNAADARAHFDSHSHCELKEGDRVVVRRYPDKIRLLHPSQHDYYHMLREKLHWSEKPGR
ncbi:MAG: NAD kinase [Betaproteobacteria bacterium]|nr:NAD kinase [Betaproteobacteria bacterium]